ncbi:hypothetical protein BTR23_13260 [Alkalihalophilus pseudofirmus]|nr:hypothetical protein BTR23_13260 [Alkalihalophilus pseudofirmus]
MIYQYLPVERIHYGVHVVTDQLIKEIQKLKGTKVLIVTTNSMLSTKAYKNMIVTLHDNHLKTFETCSKQHVPGNILMEDVKEIREFNPDIIISCGGGSPIDSAKILSFVLSEGIESEEELFPYSVNVGEKEINMTTYIPHIAIPTTLSAGEYTSIAGVTNSINHAKYKFSHLNMTPKLVFLDPIFTEETPDWLWISTGIRAVDHAVETLYSPNPNPVNTGLALQALKKLYYHLPLSKNNPTNLDYRLECQVGAWLSLFSVVNIKLGLSHSIGHQLGANYNIPHGMTSAIMLPHVMKFLLARTYEEQSQIPEVLGKTEISRSVEEKASIAPSLIKGLIEDLEIPHRLRDFNVSKESIPNVVKDILMDIQGEKNALVIDTQDLQKEITALLEVAW